MHEHLIKYRITPRVLLADATQVVTVEGLDDSCRFSDDVDYMVRITAKDGWEYKKEGAHTVGGRNCTTEIRCRSHAGIITFEHYIEGEGEWRINIGRADVKSHVPEKNITYNWPWLTEALMTGFDFFVYSIGADLYGKRPFKGDLHMHSFASDGKESPALMAALYRKNGYDFISITDHYMLQPSLDAINTFSEIPTSFKIFPGEEVHPIVGGIFHMVNFGCMGSVNERALKEPEAVQKEVQKISEALDIADATDKMEVAWYAWIYNEIHKYGGIAIYPHPYWVVDKAFNVREKISREIYERKLCDVFEIFGGTDRKHNKMQVQLYFQNREDGIHFPIVASSDAHSALSHGTLYFDNAWTMVFSENAEKIPENILAGRTVAVDNFSPEDKNAYGTLRLVKYAWFLLENYYPQHDILCNAAGQAIVRYVLGKSERKDLIAALEDETEKYNEEFFGK